MSQVFDYDKIDWEELLVSQHGKGRKFIGVRYQRGRGLGGIIKAARYLVPAFLRSPVGRELAQAGVDVARGIAQGEAPVRMIKRRGRQAIRNLTGIGKRKIQKPLTSPTKRSCHLKINE